MIKGHTAAYDNTAEAWGSGSLTQQRQLGATGRPALLPSKWIWDER